MARIKMRIPKAKLSFYPPCEVKCRLQNGVPTDSRILRGYCGVKGYGTPTHLIPSPRPTSRSKKCPRTDGENPGLQIVRPKTVVSSVGHNHGKEKRHVTQGGPPEDHEGDSRPYRLAIGGWWRDNPRRSHHLRIKYTQLILWPRWCGCDPWTAQWGSQLLTERQKEWLRGRALEDRSGWLTSVRGGKRPRMTKECPKLIGEIADDRHVLSELVSWKERAIHHPQQPSPSFLNEGTSVGGQLWEHGERAIVKESVTSALNARSSQPGRINEGMTPKQCHPVYYNS